jgi:hypothetical protein
MVMTSLHDIAEQTIGRILGEAAFIFTDKLEKNAIPALETWGPEGVSLKFNGEPSGIIRMWVSPGFACFAAANMLGVEDGTDVARQKGMDALKELLNMIVGNFITEAYGEAPVFKLALPQKLESEELEKDYLDPEAIWLEAEGNPILFTVSLLR